MPSLVNQVEMALKSVLKLGWKKSALAPEIRARLIFGGRTMEVYLEWCCRFVRWAREPANGGLRRLVELPPLAAQAWVQGMIDARRSAWTVSMAISALRKLEWGIYTRWGWRVKLIDPAHLVDRQRRLLKKRRRRGAYPAADLRLLRLYLPAEYRGAMDACVALGLRRKEVLSVQASHVDLSATVYEVKGLNGQWTDKLMPSGYAGVVRVRRGKGGRPRAIPVPDWYRPQLEYLVQGRAPEDRLWPIQARAFGAAVARACEEAGIDSRGVHGFRHSWALQRLFHLMGLGLTEDAARQTVSWWLGHNRLPVTASYLSKRPQPGFDIQQYVSEGA